MDFNDLSSFKKLFVQTARENLKILDDTINSLRIRSDDAEFIALAHRTAHSLKSEGLALGFASFGEVFREIEMYLSRIKNDDLKISKEGLDIISECLTKATVSVNKIEIDDKEIDMSEEISKLKSITA